MQVKSIIHRMAVLMMATVVAIALTEGAEAKQGVQTKIVKFATLMPQGAPGDQELRQVFHDLEKDTGGEIRVQTYAGGVAGDELDVIRKMRANLIQMGAFTGNGLGQIVPHVRVLEAPNLFMSYGEEDYVKGKMFPEFARDFEKNGFVLLGLAGAGFVYVFSKQNLDNLDLIKTLKMWTWKGDPLADTCMRELGANMVPLHLADVNTGLQTGMIDTFYITAMGCTALQWYSHARYMINYPATMVSGGLVMTKRSFDQISPENQELLKKTILKSQWEGQDMIRNLDAKSQIQIQEAGITFIEPSQDLIDYFLAGGNRAIESCIKQGLFSREVYNRALELRNEYRRNNPGETWKTSVQERLDRLSGSK